MATKAERDKLKKKPGFPSLFGSFFGGNEEENWSTSTEDLPASPPPTPTNFDNTRTTADEEISNSNDLVQELKELGIDVSNTGWKDNLKKILKNEELISFLISDRTQLLEGKDELFRKDLEIKNQLRKQLIEAEKERDSIIIQRDKRANITLKDLQNLQNEKKLVEQKLSKLQEKVKKAGQKLNKVYLTNEIDNATANLKNQLDEAVNNANDAKILTERNLVALQTDLNNNYLKKDDINRIVVIAKDKGLIDPLNYGELAKAKLVKQSTYDIDLKTVTNQRDSANKIIINTTAYLQVTDLARLPNMGGQTLSQILTNSSQLTTVQTDLANEKITHNKTKGRLTTLQNQIDNAKRELGVNDLTTLPVLPVGTTSLGDLISQFDNLQGQVTSLRQKLSVVNQQKNEYSDILKNHLGIDISNPNWKKDLIDELDGKNLKDLIDGLKVSATTITNLQTELEKEQKQLERQKIVNQQLSRENGHLQKGINDREVNLLKYFIEQLSLEVEITNKEQVLAKIWELINSKPSERVVEDLKKKIQEQKETIANYHQGENYVLITDIRNKAAECLKNCGIDSTTYQKQISQVTSFKEVAAFQQQAIKQEISKLKSQKDVTKNLNIVLCFLFLGLLMIIIYLRMKMNNSKRKVVK